MLIKLQCQYCGFKFERWFIIGDVKPRCPHCNERDGVREVLTQDPFGYSDKDDGVGLKVDVFGYPEKEDTQYDGAD